MKKFAFTTLLLLLIPATSAYASTYTTVAAPLDPSVAKFLPHSTPENTDTSHSLPSQQIAAFLPCPSACPSAYSPQPSASLRGFAGPKVGNAILQNLPTLFVLDSLFKNSSDGILSPGPTSLSDILILYQIFFTPVGTSLLPPGIRE